MRFFTHLHRSRLVDFLRMPNLVYVDYSKVDLTSKERAVMADALEAVDEVKHLLKPYEERIDRYYRGNQVYPFFIRLYHYLLAQGQDPLDMAELLTLIGDLPSAVLECEFARLLTEEKADQLSLEEIIALLEEFSTTPARRWEVLWSYQNLQETVQGMIALYQELCPLYEPVYARFEDEVRQFAENLAIETVFANSSHDVLGIVAETGRSSCQVFVSSPLHFMQIVGHDKAWPDQPAYFQLFPRVASFVANRQVVDQEVLDVALKAISDPVRYDILKRVGLRGERSKVIADSLAISPSTVTFHVQKLVNANLLLISGQTKGNYSLNRPLLQEVLERVKLDFELD